MNWVVHELSTSLYYDCPCVKLLSNSSVQTILSMCTFHNIDPVIDAIETSRKPWWRLVFVAHILLLLLLLCPAPIRRGIKRWWPSYVCPSACLSRPQRFWPTFENGKTYSKLKIGKKEAHDTDEPWPHLDVERSKVKVTRPLNAVTENHLCIRNGKTFELQTWYHTDEVRWPASPTCAVTSNLKAVGGCLSPLAGGGGILWRPHYRPHSLLLLLLLLLLSLAEPQWWRALDSFGWTWNLLRSQNGEIRHHRDKERFVLCFSVNISLTSAM